MQTRVPLYRASIDQLRTSLKSFQDSGARFKVLTTIDKDTFEPVPETQLTGNNATKTLFILDSSFNPPSIAHQSLAESALHLSSSDAFPRPHRLLLLFSTMNADKAPSAADFDQRLAMMAMFSSDLLRKLSASSSSFSIPSVDIGVTTAPYYTDKSIAIQQDGQTWYSAKPKHVHLIGYDTLTRVFAVKYYKDFDPPISALNPYFDAGHEMRATMRPSDEYGTVDEQKAFLEQLRSGKLEAQGGKPEWAKQVHLVPPNPKTGVSSTKIRNAAKLGDWSIVRELCTPTVAQWVEKEKLYNDDAEGRKMG